MTRQSTRIWIPLLELSENEESNESMGKLPLGLKQVSEIKIQVSHKLPDQCFALEVPDIFKETVNDEKPLGIFGPEKDGVALRDIYLLGLKGRKPVLCKVIKNEAKPIDTDQEDRSPSGRAKHPRKSFMTPTPLHIPNSRISPIPDASHEMIYLKDLKDNEGLKVIPSQDVVWMYPLVFVTAHSQG